MNPRSCLLCGKSLSRIWVGAGEDFCSREHRNQYRLRLGMDRLQEANKVATLMRKRENPKPITPPDHCGHSEVRLADSSQIRFSNGQAVTLPASKWSPPVRIPAARSWILRYRQPLPDTSPREFEIPWHEASRLILKKGARGLNPAGANCIERMRRTRELPALALMGQALRVSAGAGFRLPAMRAHALRTARHTPVMRSEEQPRKVALFAPDRTTVYTIPIVNFNNPGLRSPAFPIPIQRTALVVRRAIEFERRPMPDRRVPEARGSRELWTSWQEAMPGPIRHRQERSTPLFVMLPQQSIGGQPTPHMVLMPLLPEDRAFGYIPAIATVQARLSGVPRSSLEEQFDAGLGDWVGGTEEWILDAAGARTGSLAIFVPTLEERDYDMEFLARIDHHSITWVFRASDLNEYYLATIATTPDGGYEFKHGSLIDGVTEFAPAEPIRVPLNRKKSVNIRLRAVRHDFAVFLDGQVIDTWTDTRLPAGGIGFLGAPDDRARIYWVRLSQAGSPGKESSKR